MDVRGLLLLKYQSLLGEFLRYNGYTNVIQEVRGIAGDSSLHGSADVQMTAGQIFRLGSNPIRQRYAEMEEDMEADLINYQRLGVVVYPELNLLANGTVVKVSANVVNDSTEVESKEM